MQACPPSLLPVKVKAIQIFRKSRSLTACILLWQTSNVRNNITRVSSSLIFGLSFSHDNNCFHGTHIYFMNHILTMIAFHCIYKPVLSAYRRMLRGLYMEVDEIMYAFRIEWPNTHAVVSRNLIPVALIV